MTTEKFCVSICDDDLKCIEDIEEMVFSYFQSKNIPCQIERFQSGAALLEACRNHSVPIIHLLILDIEMPDVDGLTVKKQLSRFSSVKRILFVTNHGEAIHMAFGVKVVGFIQKPFSYQKLVQWISVVCQELQGNKITYKSGHDTLVVAQDDILYIQAEDDYTYLYKINSAEPELVTRNVKYWENLLKEPEFVRVHRSYIVNMQYVTKIVDNSLLMQYVHASIPIGRSYKKITKERYQAYIMEVVRNRMI